MKNIIGAALLFLIMIVANDAMAWGSLSDLRLNVNIASKHFVEPEQGSVDKFNEFNPGGGLEWQAFESAYLTAGMFRNSYNKQSSYIGVGQYFTKWHIGYDAGYITGYEKFINTNLMLLPYVKFGDKLATKIYIGFEPEDTNDAESKWVDFIGLQFQYQLGCSHQ